MTLQPTEKGPGDRVPYTRRAVPARGGDEGAVGAEATAMHPAAVADQEPIDVWLVRDELLSATRHRVDPPVTPRLALEELLAGPTSAEQNRSLRTAIPDASAVVSVEVSGGVASVGLASSFSEIPASDQVLAVGQIVLTLTDLRGIGRVRFLVDDAQIAVPLPTGDATEDSVSRDDYILLVAAG